jgi:hypothetical protein
MFAGVLKDYIVRRGLVGDVDTEIGFRLTHYNFIVLFWLSLALTVSMERSSDVSGHKIRAMRPSHKDLEISKWIWQNGAGRNKPSGSIKREDFLE